jgi:hypothetical protein
MYVTNLRQTPSFQTLDTLRARIGVVDRTAMEQGGLQGLFGKHGGLQKAGAVSPSMGRSPSPFSESSFSPSSGKAPVELNPGARGPSAMSPGVGAGSSAGLSADAKLGGGQPSTLGQHKKKIESVALAARIWRFDAAF